MNPRFDVFRKQTEHFIRWIGTATCLEDVEKLIRADSSNATMFEDEYVVVHTAYGTTESVARPLLKMPVAMHSRT